MKRTLVLIDDLYYQYGLRGKEEAGILCLPMLRPARPRPGRPGGPQAGTVRPGALGGPLAGPLDGADRGVQPGDPGRRGQQLCGGGPDPRTLAPKAADPVVPQPGAGVPASRSGSARLRGVVL